MRRLLITIDGPAGAGKTTTSRLLADRLGFRYVDTGALYRAVAYEAQAAGLNADNDIEIGELCKTLKLEFRPSKKGVRLISNNTDITDQIRSFQITMLASAVSAKPVVREYLLDVQRKMGKAKNVVFEGRDMGTVVFPDAEVKFFLNASIEIRAKRRFEEIKSETSKTIKEVEQDIQQRDKNDSTRSLAPLKPAEDAIIIDSSNLSIEEVIDVILGYIRNRGHKIE